MFNLFKSPDKIFFETLSPDFSYALAFGISVTEELSLKIIIDYKSQIFKTIDSLDFLNKEFLDYTNGSQKKKTNAAHYLILMASILSITNLRNSDRKWGSIDIELSKKVALEYWKDAHDNFAKFKKLYEDVFIPIHEYADKFKVEILTKTIAANIEDSHIATRPF